MTTENKIKLRTYEYVPATKKAIHEKTTLMNSDSLVDISIHDKENHVTFGYQDEGYLTTFYYDCLTKKFVSIIIFNGTVTIRTRSGDEPKHQVKTQHISF